MSLILVAGGVTVVYVGGGVGGVDQTGLVLYGVRLPLEYQYGVVLPLALLGTISGFLLWTGSHPVLALISASLWAVFGVALAWISGWEHVAGMWMVVVGAIIANGLRARRAAVPAHARGLSDWSR